MSTRPASQAASLAAQIKEHAADLGWDACGIADASETDPEGRLQRWLDRGFHADMDWIARTAAERSDVQQKLPGTASVVVVARSYYHEALPDPPDGAGLIARYALGKDYHKVLKKPLIALARFIEAREAGVATYVSVDAGPVLERSWAERAGLGWTGKNSLILRRDLGSWFLLGCILTTLPLAADSPMPNHCGSCRACIDACPTDAIVEAGVVDSNRCISYHTIENRGAIPPEIQENMGNWVFGCDICQEVCPWNRFAKEGDHPALQPREAVTHPPLATLLEEDEAAFNARFAGTPVRRTKHQGMQRNATIALGNVNTLRTQKTRNVPK